MLIVNVEGVNVLPLNADCAATTKVAALAFMRNAERLRRNNRFFIDSSYTARTRLRSSRVFGSGARQAILPSQAGKSSREFASTTSWQPNRERSKNDMRRIVGKSATRWLVVFEEAVLHVGRDVRVKTMAYAGLDAVVIVINAKR